MKSEAQKKFEKEREALSEKEILMEILYANFLTYQKTEDVRSNTAKLVNIIMAYIVVMLFVGLFFFTRLN